MNVLPFSDYYQAASANRLVLALHCSGSVGGQWYALRERLGTGFVFSAPNMIGTRNAGHCATGTPVTLAQAATPLIETIDLHEGPVHLVGHSYGGGIALHVAARRPERIASLTLYEPSAFHLLTEMGAEGRQALAEIMDVAGTIRAAVDAGAPEVGAEYFIDYWNEIGSWRAMKPTTREEILAYLPKAPLEFAALAREREPGSVYSNFRFPVMVMHGGRSPRPVLLIADYLAHRIPAAVRVHLIEAGHMGPISHPHEVAERFARHIENACVFFHGHSCAAQAGAG